MTAWVDNLRLQIYSFSLFDLVPILKMFEKTLQKGVKNKVLFFKWDSDCLCACVCGGAVAGERP